MYRFGFARKSPSLTISQLESKKAEVESFIDRLLGRKQALDPDFAEMRRDNGFRQLIAKMCEGTNDPNCVYGAQRDGRER